ncbi:hypothetical protein FPV67DRAFT_1486086 [Lyophyllum atratum]|nr:hypothetical protein FPV67DRAFT_1486086 [Lyophyllum atratum]
MTRTRSVPRDTILPLVVFPSLILLAKRFIFGHLYESGLAKHLAGACTPAAAAVTPYHRPYTGVHHVDACLCPLVTFFHAALDEPDALSFLTYFVGVAAPLIAIPAIEGWRAGRSGFIAYPVIFGLLSQTLTVGMTFPIYWLIFMLSGGANTSRTEAKITRAHAEAIVFAIIVGGTIPSVCLLMLSDPQVTAIWQPYPIYVSLAQFLYLAFRPASKHSESGYKTIRFLYISMFILTSSAHILTIWPLIMDFAAIQRRQPTVGIRVLDFLKWDAGFGLGASIIATFWFARNVKEVVVMAFWNETAVPKVKQT